MCALKFAVDSQIHRQDNDRPWSSFDKLDSKKAAGVVTRTKASHSSTSHSLVKAKLSANGLTSQCGSSQPENSLFPQKEAQLFGSFLRSFVLPQRRRDAAIKTIQTINILSQ